MVDNTQSPIFNAEQVVAEDVSFEDFLTRFADVHAEWVMGKVIVVTNNTQHQVIIGILFNLFTLFMGMRSKSLGQVLLAGVPMWISDALPAREPDLIVVLKAHQDRIRSNHLLGPADIVVEIVSPESTIRDRVDKVTEYAQAGVPEYWLVDPIVEQATIYRLGADGMYKAMPMDSDGNLVSSVLEGFRLKPAMLWQEEPPTGGELVGLVQRMIGQ
jgi:Uma2 family endonuclease